MATERASRYAPPPKYEPFIAGVTGLLVAQAVVMVFLGFAGFAVDDFSTSATWTALVGFAVPFAFFQSQKRKHHKAVERERTELQEEDDASDISLAGSVPRPHPAR